MIMITMLGLVRLLFMAAVVNLNLIMFTCIGCQDFKVLHCKRLQGCIGRNGTSYILSVVSNVASVKCATICAETLLCVLYFYNKNTRSCSLHSRTLADMSLDLEEDTACYMNDDVQESWAVELLARSGINYINPESLSSATVLTGPVDGNHVHFKKDRAGFVEFRFASEMYIEQIVIFESHHPGGVRQISLMSTAGSWDTVWSTEQLTRRDTAVMSPKIKITDYKTSKVRIDIGVLPNHLKASLDAVKVIGNKRMRFK